VLCDKRLTLLVALLLAAIATACSSSDSITNGQSIFQTGRDSSGAQIVAQPPALYHKCAVCHHADGSGGVHLPGGAVSADLRYKALVTDQKRPYTLALLERALSTGIDNEGQQLNRIMPHWKLSKSNRHDVANYVLTQLK
jgi:cytochrome c553